ncbi:hypothetical protein J6T66_05280 [bacterium]|nr:hypothetical protein [bacterium]
MKHIPVILAVLGMVVLAALIGDFGYVVISLFTSSSFSTEGVRTVDQVYRFNLPWKEIGFYAGLILTLLSPLAFFGVRSLNKEKKELERELWKVKREIATPPEEPAE